MSEVYITKSNYSKVAAKVIGELNENIGDICARIYGTKNLTKYLNHREIKDIEHKRLLIENASKYINEYLENKKHEERTKAPSNTLSSFVFVSNKPPKFHFKRDCDFLTKDYHNFYIPPEIEERGKNEVQKFRDFANENRHLLNENKEDLFVFRLISQFKLQGEISKVVFTNTGVREFGFCNAKEDIENRIDEVFNSIDKIGESEEGEKLLRKYIFLGHNMPHKIPKNDEGALDILRLKSELIDLLMRLHMANNSKSDFSLNRDFLESIGFEGCAACGGEFDL